MSKGSGLAFVADRLGFTPEETVACGDGENDRELLDWAGFGVAVANAHDGRARARRSRRALGAGRRRGRLARGLLRLTRVIDLRAARAAPEEIRAALARKGAAELFDELLAADRAVREVQPRVEELRAAAEAQGQADARAA